MNSYSDLEKLELYAQQINDSGIDITPDQKNEWTMIAYACASQGEAGREPYHLICSNYPNYSREDCDRHFSYCLKTRKNCVGLGSLVKIAKDHGLELKLPRGRRRKTPEQREEEQQNKFERMRDALKSFGQWRYNVWTKHTQVKEGEDVEWRDVTDLDDSTYITRLKLSGLNVSKNDMIDMASSRDFAPEYDACKEYLASLKPWEEFGSADAIDDMFRTHLKLRDEDNADFNLLMLKKWFVNMVAMMLGLEDENPQMPVFEGSEHIGKTFVARRLLPPVLMPLRVEVSPAQQKDKDFLLTLSDTPLLLFDELEINGREANTLKHAITSNDSYVRASYGRKSLKRKRRASLIATTNDRQFLPDMEGRRRFLVVSLTGTEKWEMTAEDYAEVYAQAVYLVHDEKFDYKPTKEEALHISELNCPHRIPNDCEAVLSTLIRKPQGMEKGVALSAGDIICLLKKNYLGGHDYGSVNIGKAMTNMGFASKTVHGYTKYLCVIIDDPEREERQAHDAELI